MYKVRNAIQRRQVSENDNFRGVQETIISLKSILTTEIL